MVNITYVTNLYMFTSLQPTPPTPYPPLTNSPYVYSKPYGISEQYKIRHFVLEWHEGHRQDDYHIKVNTSHKGFWPTDVPYHSESFAIVKNC